MRLTVSLSMSVGSRMASWLIWPKFGPLHRGSNPPGSPSSALSVVGLERVEEGLRQVLTDALTSAGPVRQRGNSSEGEGKGGRRRRGATVNISGSFNFNVSLGKV